MLLIVVLNVSQIGGRPLRVMTTSSLSRTTSPTSHVTTYFRSTKSLSVDAHSKPLTLTGARRLFPFPGLHSCFPFLHASSREWGVGVVVVVAGNPSQDYSSTETTEA